MFDVANDTVPETASDRAARLTSAEDARVAAVKAAHWTGSKYVSGRPLVETTQLVRTELKAAAKAAGPLHGCKLSVRCSHGSILVAITPPAGAMVVSIRRVRQDVETPHAWPTLPRYSLVGQSMLAAAEGIVNQYGFDRSDLCTDYHHCAFFLSVGFAEGIESAQWAEAEAAIRGARLGSMG